MIDPVTERILEQFDPQPLRPSDQSDLRVELDEERSGEDGVAARISRRILYSRGKPSHHVVAGHRGSGKSTELLCTQACLAADKGGVFAVYADLSKDVDYNDIDLLDVLVAMVRHLAVDLREKAGIELKPSYLRDRARRLWELLQSPIELESLDVPALVGQLSVAIKGSPDARSKLREAFEPDAGNWLNAINDVIDEARLELSRKGFRDLCLIVDDLDKLNRVMHARADCPISENLFVHRAPQLTQLRCHVIYSIPLELAISHNAPTLRQSYGGEVPVIPMVRVRKRPPSPETDSDGLKKLREVCDRRCSRANVRLTDLCDSNTLDQLILLSGGQPTELMTLVSDCILRKRPFDRAAVESQAVRGSREYSFLRADHWDLIESVQKDGEFERTKNNESSIRELLASRALLQYQNGDVWYRPNPYIESLKRPQ